MHLKGKVSFLSNIFLFLAIQILEDKVRGRLKDESDGWFVPYEEVPMNVDSMKKKKLMTLKEGVLQVVGCPMISNRRDTRSKSLSKRELGYLPSWNG